MATSCTAPIADAICDLLRARVEAERMPTIDDACPFAHPASITLDREAGERRDQVVAALDESIELAAWALAKAKPGGVVIPFHVPHVARKAA